MSTDSRGIVAGVEIGTEIVASDFPVHCPLDLKNTLGGNSSLPLGDRVLGDADSFGELGLRTKNFEDPVEGGDRVVHIDAFLHRRLSNVNRRLSVKARGASDNTPMVDMPRPEHYKKFSEWLDAARRIRGLRKHDIATIAGVSPQAASKWFKGGDVKPEALRKLSDWAAVPYEHLRLLLEGQAISPKPLKVQAMNPDTQRIARKIEMLSGNDVSLTVVESLVDTLLSHSTIPIRKQK